MLDSWVGPLRRHLLLRSIALACALPTLAWAQAGGTDPAAPQAGGAISLPELNVSADQERGHSPVRGFVAPVSATATKTDTPVLETPQSVSTVTRDQIEA